MNIGVLQEAFYAIFDTISTAMTDYHESVTGITEPGGDMEEVYIALDRIQTAAATAKDEIFRYYYEREKGVNQ